MRKLSIITSVFAAMVATVLLLPAEASAAETKPVKDRGVAPSSRGPAATTTRDSPHLNADGALIKAVTQDVAARPR